MAEFTPFAGTGHRLGSRHGNQQYFTALGEQPTRLAIEDAAVEGDDDGHGVVQVDASPGQEESPVAAPDEAVEEREALKFEMLLPGEAASSGISRAHCKVVCWDDVSDDTKGQTIAQWEQLFEKYTALVMLWQHKIKGNDSDEQPLGPDFLDWCEKVLLMVAELKSMWSSDPSRFHRDEVPEQMHQMRGVHTNCIMWQLQTQVEILDAAKDDSSASIAPVGDFQELDEGQVFAATPEADAQPSRTRWKPNTFEARGSVGVALARSEEFDESIAESLSRSSTSDSSEPLLAPQGKSKGKPKHKAKAKPSHVPRPKKRARHKSSG